MKCVPISKISTSVKKTVVAYSGQGPPDNGFLTRRKARGFEGSSSTYLTWISILASSLLLATE